MLSCLSCSATVRAFSSFFWLRSVTFSLSVLICSACSAIWISFCANCARSSSISFDFSSSCLLKLFTISSSFAFDLLSLCFELRNCCCKFEMSSRLSFNVRWIKAMFSTIACLLAPSPWRFSTFTRPSASLIWSKPSWICERISIKSFDSFCDCVSAWRSESIVAAEVSFAPASFSFFVLQERNAVDNIHAATSHTKVFFISALQLGL